MGYSVGGSPRANFNHYPLSPITYKLTVWILSNSDSSKFCVIKSGTSSIAGRGFFGVFHLLNLFSGAAR